MSQPILVVAECKGSSIRRVTFEAIAVAQKLLQQRAGAVHCFLAGPGEGAELQQAARELLTYGASEVHLASSSEQTESNALASLKPLQSLVQQLQPQFVIAGHTAYGRELAPRLAASLASGYIADATAVELLDDGFAFTRPLYAGKAFETRRFTGAAPHIVTIRPNNHEPAAPLEAVAAANESAINTLPASAFPLRSIVREVVTRVSSGIDLTEADIIVAGGRGVRGSEGFQLLQQLADQLGGAVGASRAACDAGYCDYSLQIGQTGKVVTPQLYIACGISGAIQHLAGMSQSRTIIAINKDPEAPIFSIADYGIVGDLFEIVPLLTDELKKLGRQA